MACYSELGRSMCVPSTVKLHLRTAVPYLLHSNNGHLKGMLPGVLLYSLVWLFTDPIRKVTQFCTP